MIDDLVFESGETQQTWEIRKDPERYRRGVEMYRLMMAQVTAFNRSPLPEMWRKLFDAFD